MHTRSFFPKLAQDLKRNRFFYLLALLPIMYYVIFHYWPMYGVIIAFKDFSPEKGVLGSAWAGFKHFINFFNGLYFTRVVRNTILINIFDLLWGFPAPIILALLMNELRSSIYKRAVQTVTYLPHFISMVVVCGIIVNFTSTSGLFNDIANLLGLERYNFLMKPEYFRTIYVGSGIWQTVGWGSIIYMSALAGINVEIFESAVIDGAGKWRQLWHITLPGIASTIIIMLILRMGSMMNVGFEKVMLLYNPNIYETSDVISTYVYRKGLVEMDYSFSAAVGLFNSAINFALVVGSNFLSRKFSETSLW